MTSEVIYGSEVTFERDIMSDDKDGFRCAQPILRTDIYDPARVGQRKNINGLPIDDKRRHLWCAVYDEPGHLCAGAIVDGGVMYGTNRAAVTHGR
jgi:hypothetical protein